MISLSLLYDSIIDRTEGFLCYCLFVRTTLNYHNRYHCYIASTIINILCGSTRCCCLEFLRLAGAFELAPGAIGFPCDPWRSHRYCLLFGRWISKHFETAVTAFWAKPKQCPGSWLQQQQASLRENIRK